MATVEEAIVNLVPNHNGFSINADVLPPYDWELRGNPAWPGNAEVYAELDRLTAREEEVAANISQHISTQYTAVSRSMLLELITAEESKQQRALRELQLAQLAGEQAPQQAVDKLLAVENTINILRSQL